MILHNKDKEIEILAGDNSYYYETIMGEDTLTLYFSYPGYLEVPVGSWCDFYGKRYSLKKDSNFKKNGERNFEYTLILETAKADAMLWKVRNTVDNRIKFSYTAKPKEHLQLLVDNLNRRSSGWKVGDCIEGTEKLINYNHTYVLDGLSQLAQAYETEWQIVNKTIHLRKVEYNKDNPLKLSYGKGNGFKVGVGRESGDIPPEIILVETTDKNIDFSKYGAKELLLPKSQTLVYEGRTYKTDETGTCVMREGKTLTTSKEDSLDCTEIYPSREGTISEVLTVTEKGNTFYDFKDKDIPEALDFSECRIDGETVVIRFQTGMLAGKEFELEQTDKKLTGYVHSERRFKLVSQEIDGITMPDGGVWIPKVGDKYAVFGIQLPDAYICDNTTKTGASWDVFKQAAKYLYEHEDKQFTFTGTLNGIWAKKRWHSIGGKIVLGGFVNFSDTQFHPEGSLIRMTGIKRYVNNPYSPEIELSNDPVGTSVSSDLNKIETNEVVVDDKHKQALQFTKRRFRDAQETMEMLAGSLLNFSGAINPITVATMQMLVGDESLQFRFVNSKTNPVQVTHNVTYNASTKVLNAPAGILQHMTLGIKTMSSTHKAADYKYWDMASYNSPTLVDADKKFYLYAKCSKDNQSGTFLLSETAISLEQVGGYYHLLVGVLNTEYDSDRSYVSLYGFTEILPGQITTDVIRSADGKTYFDLASGEIGGRIVFESSAGGNRTLPELEAAAAKDASEKSNTAKVTAEAYAKAKAEAEGVIASAYADGIVTQEEQRAIADATAKANAAREAAIAAAAKDASEKYDNTKTTIDGGIVTSGTIQLAGDDRYIKAGISGRGASDSDVRIWAGASEGNKGSAPFRVLQSGKMIGTDVDLSGNIDATSGKIGGFNISDSRLIATSGEKEMLLSSNLIRFTDKYTQLYIGADTYPATGGGVLSTPIRIESNRPNEDMANGNVGLLLNIQGATSYDDEKYQYTGNHALHIPKGDICGFRLRTRRVSSSQTLSSMDSVILCINGSNDMNLTLPIDDLQDGHILYVRKRNPGRVNLLGRIQRNFEGVSSNVWLENEALAILIYDSVNNLWTCNLAY